MKRIGLALGGGGAKGLCHIAFIKAIDEMGIKPVVIAGASIGAIVGGFYAAGVSGAEMEKELESIGLRDIYKMVVDLSLFSQSAILKGKGVEEYLARKIPARTFEELSIPLKVVATDFWNRRGVVLESGELAPAIRASISMAALFEPARVNGAVLIDGGAVNPLPYDIIQPECDFTIAIDVSGEKVASGDAPIPNMVESVLSTFQIMQASIVEAKKRVSPPDLYIKPALKNIRVLDFYRYKEILSGVRDEVERFREDLERLLRTP